MAMMAAKPKSRANIPSSLIDPQHPQHPQQQQHPQHPQSRRQRQSLSAGLIWKLAVPVALLLIVFTTLDRAGRNIQDMYSITPVSKKNSNSNSHEQSIPAFGIVGATANYNKEDRIAERRKKRDQKRSNIVHDHERKQQARQSSSSTGSSSSTNWFSSGLGAFSGRYSSTNTKMAAPIIIDDDPQPDEETMLFDYNQPAVRSNTIDTTSTTLNEPEKDYSTAVTIVFVMSARENFERRSVIRETWGKDHAVYFVTGGQPASERKSNAHSEQQTTSSWSNIIKYDNNNDTNNDNNNDTNNDNDSMSIQDRLVQEQNLYQDLIDSIHPESYRALPHKLKFAYQWILQRWLTVQWLVKVDDDTVVRMDTLQTVVLDNLNSAKPIVAGRIIVGAPVHKTGKWAELLYPAETYPYWPQGSCGHAVSRPVAEYVSQKAAANQLTLYQGEDTSLGIWLDEATTANELHVTWFRSEYFTNNGNCHSRKWLIIGHQISAAQMKACYETADEWTEEYRTKVSKNLWHMNTEAQNKQAFTQWGQ